MQNQTQFKVDFVGDTTGKQFRGLFTVKVKTSHLDTIRQDEIRRTILGASPQNAEGEARDIATAYAYLVTRLISNKDTTLPEWFKDVNYGLEAEDANMLVEVNNAAFAAVAEAKKPVVKEAEAASKELAAKKDPEVG